MSFLGKTVTDTLAVIDAVDVAYSGIGIPFSSFWEAMDKQAEKEKREQEEEEVEND